MSINPSMMANAQYDAMSKTISFNNQAIDVGDYSTMEEVTHFIQDRTYAGGIYKYGNRGMGSANIEFEAKVVGDLYYMAQYDGFLTGQSNVLMMCKNQILERSYKSFWRIFKMVLTPLASWALRSYSNCKPSPGLGWLNASCINPSVFPQVLLLYGEAFGSNDCGGNASELIPQQPTPAGGGVSTVGRGGPKGNKEATTAKQ